MSRVFNLQTLNEERKHIKEKQNNIAEDKINSAIDKIDKDDCYKALTESYLKYGRFLHIYKCSKIIPNLKIKNQNTLQIPTGVYIHNDGYYQTVYLTADYFGKINV